MRHEPSGVHGIARKPAAELVVDAAGGHFVAGVQNHFHRFVIAESFGRAQQQRRNARLRKFRRVAEAAVGCVVGFLEKLRGAPKRLRRERRAFFRVARRDEFEPRVQFVGGRDDFHFPFAPQFRDLTEQLQKTWPAMPRVRRKIGAAEKRLQIGREKNIQRPAAAAGRGLHERHVNFVHVGTLLAVHLDADKMFVQKRADFFILETLALHDVTPVAGRVADAQKNRLVLRARLRERRVAPSEPVHGIMRVLEQIW